jgi:hypothetical protein
MNAQQTEDNEMFWKEVYIAVMRSGVDKGAACSYADDALEDYKERMRSDKFV